MSFLRDTLRDAARDLRAAVTLAPLEVALGVALSVGLSITVRTPLDDTTLYVRQWAASLLALGPLLAVSALRARGHVTAGARWGASAAILVASVAYAAFVYDPNRVAEVFRGIGIGVASVALGVLLPAVVARREGAEDAEGRDVFWRWWTGLLVRGFVVGVYAALLYAALAGAIAAVVGLFELETPDHLFQDIAGVVFLALAPTLVVGGLATLASGAPPTEGERTWMKRLGRFLWALVMVLYLAILYAYAVKVVATQELPRNLLSPVVLFAGVFGFLGAALLEPLARDVREAPFVGRLVRLVPALLLPLLPLAAWALLVRQAEYGWTEFRYLRMALLVALAILGAWGTVRLLRKAPPVARAVPAVLGVVALLASVGPWSAQAVSLRSQRARLEAAMREAGLPVPLRVAEADTARADRTKRVVPDTVFRAVRDGASWLQESHGPAGLAGLIEGTGEIEPYRVSSLLPIRAAECEHGPARLWADPSTNGPFRDLPGGTTVPFWLTANTDPLRHPGLVEARLFADSLRIEGNGWRGDVDLDSLRQGARGGTCDAPRPPAPLPPERFVLPVRDATGARRATAVIVRMSLAALGDSVPPRVQQVQGWLILEGEAGRGGTVEGEAPAAP